MMRRGLLILSFLLAMALRLEGAEPLLRVEILTQPPIVPGQQVQIRVDVLAPNFFLSPPKFPLFDLPNAVVALPDERAMNLVETINGDSYAGIRRSYVVTPQTAGDFTLPPAAISFTYAAVPGQPGVPASVTLPPQKFIVAGAPARGATTAQQIGIAQDLDRDPKTLKAGDTLVRTITVTAQGMQAMMIPVPDFAVPAGVRLYPHDPVLTDKLDQAQGTIDGTRIDRVTYGFETAGSYHLPAIAIAWYDPKTQKNDVAQAPEIAVTVAQAAGFTPAIKPPEITEPAPRDPVNLWLLTWVAAGIVALACLAWLVRRLWRSIGAWRKARRLRYEQSEAYFFRQFSVACQVGDGGVVYAALQSWAGRAKVAPLRDWLKNDEALADYERLEASLFAGSPGSFDVDGLLARTTTARRYWLARQAAVAVPAALPSLNP